VSIYVTVIADSVFIAIGMDRYPGKAIEVEASLVML
jgi:hypothetical protein